MTKAYHWINFQCYGSYKKKPFVPSTPVLASTCSTFDCHLSISESGISIGNRYRYQARSRNSYRYRYQYRLFTNLKSKFKFPWFAGPATCTALYLDPFSQACVLGSVDFSAQAGNPRIWVYLDTGLLRVAKEGCVNIYLELWNILTLNCKEEDEKPN